METCRWKESLEHARLMAHMVVLEGNISDVFMQENGLEAGRLVELDQYLYQYLNEAGYHSIVFYNRIDSFYNQCDETGEMLRLFYREAGCDETASKLDISQAMVGIRKAMKNNNHSMAIVVNMAGQLLGTPNHLSDHELEYLTTLYLAAKESSEAPISSERGWASNLLILVTNKVHELPAWFYRYAPFVKTIEIEMPGEGMRRELLFAHGAYYQDWNSLTETEKDKLVLRLLSKTEGMSSLELDGIFTSVEGRSVKCIEEQIYNHRHGKKDNPWMSIDGKKVKNISSALSSEVLGQEKAVSSVVDIILRATTGLAGIQHSSGTRPRGVMLFAGPTGVGKTELAKTMARELFGSEEAMIRFDMSEYSQSHSDQRLLGAPPGYVGYDAGGELTNAIKSKPFSILLFDEIEKANPTILDKFLQILDDGRMTDSRGETVYFTECLIVFTSNIGMNTLNVENVANGTKEYPTQEVLEKQVVQALRENWRPEFVNRIGQNIIVFDYIREAQAEMILRKQLNKVRGIIFEQNNIDITWKDESEFYKKMRQFCLENLQYGGRGIGNVVEHYFITPVGREIAFEHIKSGTQIELIDFRTDAVGIELIWN